MGKQRKEEREVLVYTSATCGACPTVTTMLDGQNVEYEPRNISENEDWAEELKGLGAMGVPAIVVDGELKSVGFDYEVIQELGGK